MSTTKSFVINTNMAKLTNSHITQLFKPTYNPKTDDDKYIVSMGTGGVPTKNFSLQEYVQTQSGTIKNPVMGAYTSNVGTSDAKNIVTNLFLVTQNFLNFINKMNLKWGSGGYPDTITPVSYTQDEAGNYIAEADKSNWPTLMPILAGPSGNNASKGLAIFEQLAANGIEGSKSQDCILSSNIPELFLRHLYSTDSKKRDIAFNLAQTFYAISSSEVALAKLEMIPSENFDSDEFVVTTEEDVIKFNYNKPIKLQSKYDESIHNVSNQNLFLYFPFITSNSLRASDDLKYDYRNYVNIYTGLTNAILAPTTATGANSYVAPFVSRTKSTTGIGSLNTRGTEDAPTLVNSIWSLARNTSVYQAGYTALEISEIGGGGDLQFDHIDKIDYIDSLNIEIKIPTVFS